MLLTLLANSIQHYWLQHGGHVGPNTIACSWSTLLVGLFCKENLGQVIFMITFVVSR